MMLMDGLKRGETVLEARGITKSFPGVLANDDIDLDIRAGEIHALLGENGAGKTTLMNVLFGLLQPDRGGIYVGGRRVEFRSPLDAIDMGIGMVHQHRKLVSAHTVIENIILGHPKAGRILNLKKAEEEVNELCEKYGFSIDPRAKVWQLSEGEKQAVEILKTLYRGAKGDRVTVLRRGRVTARLETEHATEESLAREMVGREVIFRIERSEVEKGKLILEVENVSALSDKGLLALKGVSFSIREGEILGIAGVSGNGQKELAEVLAGVRKAQDGRVVLDGRDITRSSTLERWQMGMGYIPCERVDVGSIGDFSLVENTTMTDTKAKNLSGGNLQKLILGRVLSRRPRLLIASLPTQGLDVGATEFVRNKLMEAKREKAGILLISEDLDELLSLSDWVAPIYEGQLMGMMPGEEAGKESVGAMMAGSRPKGEKI
jgi:simple sugar transport system ATP-binding protein